jgi:hypothetical protein
VNNANISLSQAGHKSLTFDQLKPISTVPYADLIRGWLSDPLLARELQDLEQCLLDTGGRLDWGRVLNERPWFDTRLRQRLPLLQPSAEAIALLHKMRGNDFYLTRGEAALDWMFPRDEVERAGALIRRHVRWLHHRKPIKIFRNTMYLNPPSAAKNIALYHDLPCRKTNKPCVHCCYRMRGHPMLVRHRLATLEDWLRIDYSALFAAILLFADLDFERLGHLLRNEQSRRKGRSGGHSRSRRQSDYDEGLWHFERYGRIRKRERDHIGKLRSVDSGYWSVQQYLDQYRNYVNVHSCLIPLVSNFLLPELSHTSYGVCSIPISSSNLSPPHKNNFGFSASETTFSRTSTIPRPVLDPRPSKLLPNPRLRSWKSMHPYSQASDPPDFVVPRNRWRLNSIVGSHGGEQRANSHTVEVIEAPCYQTTCQPTEECMT